MHVYWLKEAANRLGSCGSSKRLWQEREDIRVFRHAGEEKF